MLGMVSLAILHHGSDHPRWGPMLARIGKRNLIQMKLWPDMALPSVERAFAGADAERLLMGHTAWLPQVPDHPDLRTSSKPCPDCMGTGVLRNCVGTFNNRLFEL